MHGLEGTLGYMILHYGRPWFEAALTSLVEQCDRVVVLYTPRPSQGHGTSMHCPDTEAELYAIVESVRSKTGRTPNELIWHKGFWTNEGEHTQAWRAHHAGERWIVRADADEVFDDGAVRQWIDYAKTTVAGRFSPKFIHFWRTMSRACTDGHTPVRLESIGAGNGDVLGIPEQLGRVFHMGYAQPTSLIRYKMEVQGHKSEWRPEWFEKKWMPNAQEDVHPVCRNFWTPVDFPKHELPDILRKHHLVEATLI